MSGDFALSQGNLNLGEKSEENEMLGKCEAVHPFSVLFMMTNDDTFLFGDLFVKMSIQLIWSEINMTFFSGESQGISRTNDFGNCKCFPMFLL